ncbi:toll/interleukin-1 receptor domain-containing protein [Streptomyces sp. SP17KL33]|uniref:toll/interleukin-1 receptor domain-containing protein n=1 Tax=Streptomyces sp. SP17KL33 TaxID=3002534 RepID=UPI002E79EB9F|nr:toll/interleukin-1 receptor domain-containing protein [Streptomyces sp. SP17KL33]MEE1830908.1 toll/interleukin-1 receptor domain-containing protein [Streptomyces sp. SP17KL33]
MSDQCHIYDLAVSFAGKQRAYVEQVVEACKEARLRVLYDRDQAIELWGRNLITSFRQAYNGSQARYVAPFISKEYLASPYPMDEFRAMLVPAIENPEDYILPVTIGDVVIPPELLSPAVGFLRSEDFTPDQLAHAFERRIRGSRGIRRTDAPSPAGTVTHPLRMPVTTPGNFSKYAELELSFRYLTEQFKVAAAQMSNAGFVCTVRNSESELRVRVEQRGKTLYAIDIQLGGMHRDDVLNFVLGQGGWSGGRNTSNGSASVVFDRTAGAPRLEMLDLSVFGTPGTTESYTKEELFAKLWGRLVDQVQQVADDH